MAHPLGMVIFISLVLFALVLSFYAGRMNHMDHAMDKILHFCAGSLLLVASTGYFISTKGVLF